MEVDAVTAIVTLAGVVLGYLFIKSLKVDSRHEIKDAIDADNAKEERNANATKVALLEKDVEALKNK